MDSIIPFASPPSVTVYSLALVDKENSYPIDKMKYFFEVFVSYLPVITEDKYNVNNLFDLKAGLSKKCDGGIIIT